MQFPLFDIIHKQYQIGVFIINVLIHNEIMNVRLA